MKATYECKNCRPKEGFASQIWIAYNWISTTNSSDDDSIYYFQKIGQFPPPTERIDPEVELELGDEMRLYANAIRLYNFGLGLGSMAYLRRVVENRMNHILDLLIKVAEDSEAEDSAQIVKELNKQKQARSFSDKAEYAAQVWPNLLKVKGGHNTIKLLYDRLSEGIHDWSDKSCLENFQPIREAFEFTVRQLRNKINSDEEAAQIFGKFSSRI